MDILNIKEPILKDVSIEDYEHFKHNPITGTNLNDPGGDIRIYIETLDLFTHPCESYLIIEGRLTKADGTLYDDPDNVSLTNNAMMHLYKSIRYELSGQTIEHIKHLGQATTMLGLLKYPDDFSKSQGLNQLWYKDTLPTAVEENIGWNIRKLYVVNNSDTKGTFSFRVPLKHIFGFCEDYDKVLYGMKHTLTLTRNDDHDAIFRDNGFDAGKITLDNVSWFMPHVQPAVKESLELYNFIEKKENFPVGYRMRQCDAISVTQSTSFTWRLSVKSSPEMPRFIIVGFQTDKRGNQEQNPSIFDNVGVNNIYVTLNSNTYPKKEYKLSSARQQFSRVYGDAALFRSKFYNMDDLVSIPNFTPSEYKTLYPLFVFDVSKQSEKIKYSTTSIHINADFDANVPLGTEAYAVVISDRLINFQADGNKMSVVH